LKLLPPRSKRTSHTWSRGGVGQTGSIRNHSSRQGLGVNLVRQ